jgi:hypothetical protein
MAGVQILNSAGNPQISRVVLIRMETKFGKPISKLEFSQKNMKRAPKITPNIIREMTSIFRYR